MSTSSSSEPPSRRPPFPINGNTTMGAPWSIPPTTTPTSSSNTPTPTSTPTTTLQFELPPAFIACSSSLIKWNYTGGPTSAELTLMVDNNVPQDAPPPPLSSSGINPISTLSNPNSRRQTNFINKTLSSQIDPTSGSFLWSSVNVPQGWYQLLSSLPLYGQVNQTLTFFVQEGTDTSCFITSPVVKQNHTGAIAGGIAGGIAFIIGLFIGCLYIYRRRRNPRSSISCRIKDVVARVRRTPLAATHLNAPQNSEDVEAREVGAGRSPRPAILAFGSPLYPEQTASRTYLRPGASLESLESYHNPFVDGHFPPEDPSYIESRLSLRSSSWSFVAITQPCTSVSGAEPMSYYSTQDTGSNHSTFRTLGTALPTYRSRTSTIPPSFHTDEP